MFEIQISWRDGWVKIDECNSQEEANFILPQWRQRFDVIPCDTMFRVIEKE